MPTIDPGANQRPNQIPPLQRDSLTGAASDSLRRLATGLAVRRAAQPAGTSSSSTSDSVELGAQSSAPGAAATRASSTGPVGRVGEQVRAVGTLVEEIRALVQQARESALGERPAIQKQIDATLATIDQIAAVNDFASLAFFGGQQGFVVTDVAQQVYDYRVFSSNLAEGAAQVVQVNVLASAQEAGLFLSFGAESIDLLPVTSANQRITIELAGVAGVRSFSFASGTTIADVGAALNAVADQTGVRAIVSGTGVRVESLRRISTDFVTVRIVDHGGIVAPAGSGVFQLRNSNANEADPVRRSSFTSAAAQIGVKDFGASLNARVNGQAANWDGEWLSVELPGFSASIRLRTSGPGPHAQSRGIFQAFGAEGVAPQQLGAFPGLFQATRELGRVYPDESNAAHFTLADLATGGSLSILNVDSPDSYAVADAAVHELRSLIARIEPGAAPVSARDIAADARRALLDRVGAGATGLTPTPDIVTRALRAKQ